MDFEGRNLAPVYRFVQQYVSHLLPALERTEDQHAERSKSRREHIIKFEVDMALALSATGFAWSHALKSKLERERDLAMKKPVQILPIQKEIQGNMSLLLFPESETTESNLKNNRFGSAPNKFYSGQECCKHMILKGKLGALVCNKACWKNTNKCLSQRAINLGKARYRKWRPKLFVKARLVSLKMLRKIKAKKALKSRIKILRNLTPGGNGMGTDVLFNELGNYISCLQVQVHVLHHLAESSGILLPQETKV